jgi:pilus assembly protein CpaC
MEACQLRLQGGYKRLGMGAALFLGLWMAVAIAEAQQTTPTITVTVNKSLIFSLPQKARRVSVTQPEVADVTVVAPNQLLINGKSVGVTSLVIWPQTGDIINYDLVVSPDVDALRRQLKALFGEEKIEISTSGAAIVLKGEVSNEVIYDKVLEVAQTYLPPAPAAEIAAPAPSQTVTITPEARLPSSGTAFAGGGQLAFSEEGSLSDVERWGIRRRLSGIIDMLVIREVRQIQLDVIVAEISLTKLREIGADFIFNMVRDNATSTFASLAGTQGGLTGSSLLGDPAGFPPTLPFGGATSGVINILSGRENLGLVYRLFQNRDVAEILARPSLVIKNGRTGGFLAGGEFPLPVTSTLGLNASSTVEFKPFGVRLDFLPTITWSNVIDLRIFPEVSNIDESIARVNGIPALSVRRSVSRVEMKEGESLIMSGLIDRRTIRDLTKFPILGDIPIIGALFRATRFSDQEKELVFIVTPKIVRPLKAGEKPQIPSAEKYDSPDMRQVPLPGSSTPSTSKPAPGPTIP